VAVLIALLLLAACSSPPRAAPGVVSARGSPILSTDRWEYAGHPGTAVRTRSYRFFTTATDRTLVDGLPFFLERAMEQYTTAMGPLPRPALKLDTFLMGERDQWEALTRQIMGSQAATYLKIQRGGFASGGRAILWSIGRHDTLAIAAHEGWHQYTQREFRDELPAWLEEGVAVFMEGFVEDPADSNRPIFLGWANLERFDQLSRAATKSELMPLDALLALDPRRLITASTDGTLIYYAQLWALTHFLREGAGGKHRPGLQNLVADAAAGRMTAMVRAKLGRPARDGLDVFTVYFGEPAAIAPDYDAFISMVTRDGARDLIERGRSPVGAGISPPFNPTAIRTSSPSPSSPRATATRPGTTAIAP
jgi:hypothetical protein